MNQNCDGKTSDKDFQIPKDLDYNELMHMIKGCPCSKTEYLDNFIKPNMKKPVCKEMALFYC